MGTREIKTRFKLEGEQEFRKGMADAAGAIKVLNSEEKLAKAQFEATGDAQQYAAEQTRILKEQIEQQQKAVKAAEEAVQALTENGINPNSRQMQTWRTRLNNARTSLVSMETRLDKVGTELGEEAAQFGDAETAAGNFQAQMEEVGKGINLQNTIMAIDNVTSHLEGVVQKAANAAKAVWDMGADAGAWADTIATESMKLGVDPETYQSWQYASRFIDTSVADIAKSWQDIQKKMDSTIQVSSAAGDSAQKTGKQVKGSGKDAVEASEQYTGFLVTLNKMGIASRTMNNEVRSSQDIFWDAIDALHNMKDETQRAEYATELFGNDWRNLNPLIEAGSAAYKAMAEQGRKVAVVSNENVAALGSVDDELQDFNARFDKLKYDSLAELAPTFKAVAEAMSTAVTALDEFVESEEGQEAIAGFNEALHGVVSSFLGEDGGKGTFEKIVSDAKGAVIDFTNAMEWLSENGGSVKDIIIGLGIAWAGLKATKEILLFLQLLQAIPMNKLTTVFGGSGNAAKGIAQGVGEAVTGGTGQAVAAGGGSILKTAGGALLSGAQAVGPWAGVAAAVAVPIIELEKSDQEEIQRISDELDEIKKQADERAASKGAEDSQSMRFVDIAQQSLGWDGRGAFGDPAEIYLALERMYEEDNGTALSPKTRLMLRKNHNEALLPADREDLMYQIMGDAIDSMGRPWGQITTESRAADIAEAMEGISSVMQSLNEAETPESITALRDLMDMLVYNEGVFDSISDATKDMFGEFLDPSKGLDQFEQKGTDAVKALLQSIYDDLSADKDQWVDDGKNLPKGLAEGIEENAAEATDAAAAMADDVTAAAEGALGVQSPSKVFHGIGENVAVGLANGIYARGNDAIIAAQWLAQSVANVTQAALQIHSPSKVFERLGEFTGLGFAEGIRGSADEVNRAVDVMLGATARRPVMSFGGVPMDPGTESQGQRTSRQGQDDNGVVHVTLVLDKDVLGDVMAPIVNDKIGAKIQATRR